MFRNLHPAVQFIYFVCVIGLGMFVRNPLLQIELLLLSLAADSAVSRSPDGVAGSMKRREKSAERSLVKQLQYLGFLLCLILFCALVNILTYHDGVTILFYINDNPITLEAGVYGLTVGLMIAATLSWFRVYQKVLTEDKFLYLFGRISPSFAMTISMVFRYIPLLRQRMAEISQADRAMGAYRTESSLIEKMQVKVREFSVLISWSLEQSIETAKAMEARGYGSKKRSSYHRFLFYLRDGVVLAGLLVLAVVTISCLGFGFGKIYFYPEMMLGVSGEKMAVVAGLFLLLGGLPIYLKEGMDIRISEGSVSRGSRRS